MAEETTAPQTTVLGKTRLPDGYTGHLAGQGSATTALRDAYYKSLSEKSVRLTILPGSGELDVKAVEYDPKSVSELEILISKGEPVDLSKLSEEKLKDLKRSLKYLNEFNSVNQMARELIIAGRNTKDNAFGIHTQS
jgi:hypothetical protein